MRLFDTKRHPNIISSFQKAGKLLRTLTATLVITIIAQQISPTILAAQEGKLTTKPKSPQEVKADAVKNLRGLTNRLAQLERGGKIDREHVLDRIEQLRSDVKNDESAMLDAFKQEEAWIQSKNLSPIILERHQKMVQHYRSQTAKLLEESEQTLLRERGSFLDKVKALAPFKEEKKEKMESPFQDFDPKQFTKGHKPFDPDVLPTRRLRPNPDNKPKTDKADFTLSGLVNTPAVYTAALGDFTYNNLPGADNPAYLNVSDEIVATQAINDKAKELGYDPVRINQWVRNNIEWLPTWGSAQNAELTLEAKRGNAMDIASLTIALLRSSKIPARYVHGVIEVPSEKFMNWAGGFSNINAAADYAGAGGIPLSTVIAGGKIEAIQMEHVWVEAAIDYYPSRGARNRDADSWVQMDPSFKQYDFKEGVDVLAISGIDPEKLASDLLASGTVNEEEGWATGFDPTILENALSDSQTKLKNYIDNNMTDPSVLDVIGGRQVIIKEFPVLPSSLPNRIVLTGTRYDKIPQQLQQQVFISFYGTQYQGLYGDKRSVRFPYAGVNNEKLTLSFRPASQTDEDTLAALIPDGNITDISQLPSTIPANLINVIPELKLNGTVVATGVEMSLGTKVDVKEYSFLPGLGNVSGITHTAVAGSYLSINLIAQTVSPQKLKDLKTKLENTKNLLASNDLAQLASLNREDILGDMMYAGTLGYYGEQEGLRKLMALQGKVNENVRVGNGVYGYEPKVTYLFGIAYTLSSGGVHVDLSDLSAAQALDGDGGTTKSFMRQSGMLGSSLEHMVPEQMFSTPENPAQGVSTMKALQLASAQGQKIYTINQANADAVMPLLHHTPDVMGDINAAINGGYTVTVHSDPVQVPGWTGAGYIITNEFGSGAYMISGGENGGFLVLLGTALLWTTLAFFSLPGGLLFSTQLAVIAAASLLIMTAGAFLIVGNKQACFVAYTAALMMIEYALFGVLGLSLHWIIEAIIGELAIPIGAWDACLCGQQPYCLDPLVP